MPVWTCSGVYEMKSATVTLLPAPTIAGSTAKSGWYRLSLIRDASLT